MRSSLYKTFTSELLQRTTYILVFNAILKFAKIKPKNIFWLIFGSFSIMPSYTLWVTPQFLCQMKGLMKMHNCGKFHLCSICGCKVIKLEMSPWRWSIHEMAPFFWKFLGPNFPKYGLILLKFTSELVFQENKTLFENFFKNSNFYGNGMYPKFCKGFGPTISQSDDVKGCFF